MILSGERYGVFACEGRKPNKWATLQIHSNTMSGEISGANLSLNIYTDREKTDSRKGSNTNICQKQCRKAELHIPLCDALLC